MRIPRLPTLMILASIMGISMTATAQDEPVDTILIATVEDNFMAADLDQNGLLDPDEFVSFAVIRAKVGDEAYKQTLLLGEYDTEFAVKDADASGGLTMEELGAVNLDAELDIDINEPELDESDSDPID